MKNYIQLLKDIKEKASLYPDRTGTGRIRIPFYDLTFDLNAGFPIVTTRKINCKAAFEEMLFFISGETDVRKLEGRGVNFWKRWTLELPDGRKSIGPMYGQVWRNTRGLGFKDQLLELMDALQEDPYSARHCVTAWIPELLPLKGISPPKENALYGKGVLAPCHCFWQVVVTDHPQTHQKIVNLKINIRSSDVPVGLPYNIAQYALLTHLIANHLGYGVGVLNVSLGDTHIYADQMPLIDEQINREPLPLPTFKMKESSIGKSIFTIDSNDFFIEGYQFHPAINYPVSE